MKVNTRLPNIFLIGPMGAGKSTIGRKLAQLSGLMLIDTDEEVCSRSGVDINWIFEVEGEAGFKKREAALIKELTQRKNLLLSTGGGSIIDADNRRHLKENGVVVYLQVAFDEQYERTQRRRGTRPSLEQGDSFKKNLLDLNKAREPLYQEIAELTYRTDLYDTLALAKKILADVEALDRSS